jgi:putative transposase
MPRRSRLRLAGLPVHIVQRGVNRAICFGEDADRLLYLTLLENAVRKQACSLHAYVLMSNHVHLLLTAIDPDSPSRMMKSLGERYVPAFNKRHGRTGTLWEGRFRSVIVDSGSYLLRSQRYIESNPVRAGMVRHPRDYSWSSYRANAEGEPSMLLSPHPEYLRLAGQEDERLRVYRRFFATAAGGEELERMRNCINSGSPLGDAEFLRQLEGRTGRRLSPDRGGRPRKREATSGPDTAENRGLSPV